MKSVKEMLDDIENDPPQNDIVKGLIPDTTANYVLICGRAGIGKTMLALNLAHAIATGSKFLDFTTTKNKVGYLSFEGGIRQMASRFQKIGENYPSVEPLENLCWQHDLPFKLAGGGIEKLMSIITGLNICIIDTLRPMVAGDWMKPNDASTFVNNLRKVANDTGTVLILLHHLRKQLQRGREIHPDELVDEIKGPTEYVDAAGTVLLFNSVKHSKGEDGKFIKNNPNDRILYFVKVRDAPTEYEPLKLRFNRDNLTFQPLASDSRQDYF